MKIQVLSDTHFRPETHKLAIKDVDLVVLAGDISTGLWGLKTAIANSQANRPVIYVPGNHEFYGQDYDEWHLEAAKLVAAEPHTFLLTGTSQRFEEFGVTVVGATLWTDFAIFGADKAVSHALIVGASLNDFRLIRKDDKRFTAQQSLEIHIQELAAIKREVSRANARGDKVIVVTHHAPSLKSSSEKYKKDPVTAGFGSNLEEFAASNVDLWIHGHMHNNSDYHIGRCRVVCNPFGYLIHGARENPHFDAFKVVEI